MSAAPATPPMHETSGPVAAHWAMGCLVLALGMSVSTCRLDKLINPATADLLTVSPRIVDTSAHAGSDITSLRFRVATSDGGVRDWQATWSAVWLTLSRDAGTTPDSVLVMIDPDTLSQAVYEDTIVFAASGDTIRVAVTVTVLPPSPELSITPVSRAETAFVGSVAPDTFSLTITNTGALPLTWSAVVDSSWIAISRDSGGAPPAETSVVTLTPGSLAPGTHVGAITVTAAPPGTVNSPATVPVTYVIRPCAETGITPDAVVSGAITLSDCGAPQRAGRQAKVYAVQAATGDTLSFRLTSVDFDAYLVFTNPSGVAVLAENDECGIEVGTACIKDFIVSNPGRYLLEVTTANAAAVGAFTLSAVKELSPSQPAAGQFRANGTTAIAVGAVTPESTVVFKATLNDPNPGDSVRLEVEVEGLATGPQTHVSPFVPRGNPVALSVTPLNDNEGYHWRARTCDQSGRCSTWFNFGGNVDPAADFIVNSIPQAPDAPGSPDQFNGVGTTPMPPGGGTGGGLGSNQTVTFRAVVTDPDPGDMVSLEVEVKDVMAAFDGVGTTRGVAVSSGSTAAVSVIIQAPLLGQNSYYWRARACDQASQCGSWVSFGGPAGDGPPRVIDFHVP